MNFGKRPSTSTMIDINQIHILNPRSRNQKKFANITDNIAKVGLKRPITVTRSMLDSNHGKNYELVCGQGRIEAFLSCGQEKIPAIIIDTTEEQALIMSLVENLARRQRSSIDLMHGIEVLCKQGYDAKAIATKTGLSLEYAHGVVTLLEHGEERLLTAVEMGRIPVSTAVTIAESPGDEQRALQEAYESKELRGKKLLMAKRLLETRKRHGKSIKSGSRAKGANQKETSISSNDILKIYQHEIDRKRLLARKADATSSKLLFITEALKMLRRDDNFINVLRAENLATFPKQLSLMMEARK